MRVTFVLWGGFFSVFSVFERNHEDLETWRYSGWRGYQKHSSPIGLEQGWHWIQTWELFPVRLGKPPGKEKLSGQSTTMIAYPQREKYFLLSSQILPCNSWLLLFVFLPCILTENLAVISVGSWVLGGSWFGPWSFSLERLSKAFSFCGSNTECRFHMQSSED